MTSDDTNDQSLAEESLPGSPREIMMGLYCLPVAGVFDDARAEEAAARVLLHSHLAGKWVDVSLRELLTDIALEPSLPLALRQKVASLAPKGDPNDIAGAIVDLIKRGHFTAAPERDKRERCDVYIRPTPQFLRRIFDGQRDLRPVRG